MTSEPCPCVEQLIDAMSIARQVHKAVAALDLCHHPLVVLAKDLDNKADAVRKGQESLALFPFGCESCLLQDRCREPVHLPQRAER